MKDSPQDWRRVALFVSRITQMSREFFGGIMDYAAQHPQWFVRVFEVGADDESPMIDFGVFGYPDAAIVCDVPARYVRLVLNRIGLGDIPIVGFMEKNQVDCDIGGDYDCDLIAHETIKLFRRCGCAHIGYFGTHNSREIRISRAFWRNFSRLAEKDGMPVSTLRREVYDRFFVKSREVSKIAAWIRAMPKPCGIVAYDDVLAASILNICRHEGLSVPDEVNVLGIGNDQIICEAMRPSISSVVLDYPRTGYLAAKQIDLALDGKTSPGMTLSCGVKMVAERGSTVPLRTRWSSGRLNTFGRTHAVPAESIRPRLRGPSACRCVCFSSGSTSIIPRARFCRRFRRSSWMRSAPRWPRPMIPLKRSLSPPVSAPCPG